MFLSLFELSSADGKTIQDEFPFGPDEIVFRLGSFPILEKDPIRLEITNTGDKVLKLHVQGRMTVAIPCDRCLDEVPTEIFFDSEGKLDMKLTEEEREEEKNEYSCLNGTDLDVDRLVYLEVLMNWPYKVLCKEDCKGICSRCGKNLNEGPCGCADEPKDPRMAAISDIFRNFKEV